MNSLAKRMDWYTHTQTKDSYGEMVSTYTKQTKQVEVVISLLTGDLSPANNVLTESSTHAGIIGFPAVKAGDKLQTSTDTYVITLVIPHKKRNHLLYLREEGQYGNRV